MVDATPVVVHREAAEGAVADTATGMTPTVMTAPTLGVSPRRRMTPPIAGGRGMRFRIGLPRWGRARTTWDEIYQ